MTSPQNLTERSSFPLRPDNVPCYVRDEGAEDFPKRAYSVGSKPVPVVNKPLNNSYIDMSGKSNAKKEAEKSSSAPHLNDDDEKKRELSDLFMELDFNRSKRDVNHKGASEFRGRASSGGSRELRMKAMSFGAKEAIQRFSLFSKTKPSAAQQHSDARRPRTSTICQESLRPRTSSFGPSDQRPRSSSGGNACFVDVMSRQLQVGGEPSSSQDSLRRHGKRPSQERIKSGQSDAYVNMNLGRRSTEWLKMAESDAGYMDMKPSEDVGEPNYMRMSAGTSGPAPAATTSGESVSARPSLGVMMKPKLEVVDAGGSKDYLAMTPGGASQSKLHGVASSNRPRVKVTKSTDETNSSYMEMAPRGASSEKSVEANSERKDVHLSRKYDDYMEMSVGGSGKHRDTSAALNQAQNVAADAHATSERARGSVVLASSPNREDFKGSGRQLSASPKEDIPPPPFDLSFPSPSFFLRADQAAPTIPGQSPASRTEPQTAAGGSASERLSGQISYATLDLGSSVDHCPAAPLAEGRGGTGAVGRGRSFGQGSHQHVYAQIDFDKTEDRQE